MKQLYASLIAVFFLFPLSAAAGGVPWGEPNNTPGRFIVLSSYNNEAVFDSETGLVWEQSPSVTGGPANDGRRNWGIAQIYCNQLNVGNRKGWRLPTLQELASLVDGDPANISSPRLPPGHPFSSNVQSSFYWSATSHLTDASDAWGVRFGGGVVVPIGRSGGNFAWCVRGGQGVDPQ